MAGGCGCNEAGPVVGCVGCACAAAAPMVGEVVSADEAAHAVPVAGTDEDVAGLGDVLSRALGGDAGRVLGGVVDGAVNAALGVVPGGGLIRGVVDGATRAAAPARGGANPSRVSDSGTFRPAVVVKAPPRVAADPPMSEADAARRVVELRAVLRAARAGDAPARRTLDELKAAAVRGDARARREWRAVVELAQEGWR